MQIDLGIQINEEGLVNLRRGRGKGGTVPERIGNETDRDSLEHVLSGILRAPVEIMS